jgi:DNA-binding CsgD family transcriptional regulator
MKIANYLALVYDLELDDATWRSKVDRVLVGVDETGCRVDTLRTHVEAAAQLRRVISEYPHRMAATGPEVACCAPVHSPIPLHSQVMIHSRVHSRILGHPHVPVHPRDRLRSMLESVERTCADASPTPAEQAQQAEIWEGVSSGTWSIIDHYERLGRRYLFVYKTDAGKSDPLRMTPMQRRALECLSRGRSDSEIAVTLGIKLDAASALVRVIKRKLRMPVRRDLIGINADCLRPIALPGGELWAALLYSSTDLAQVLPPSISDAERSILHLQFAGKSNYEIAQIRQVAYKTVSNQVAAAYSKLNVRTCGEMLHNLRVACR